jgi:hypothetical protein
MTQLKGGFGQLGNQDEPLPSEKVCLREQVNARL